jgi:sarcosine oxidase delta subunit
MIRNILFTNKAHFTRNEVNNTRNAHLWDRDNSHGTVKSNYQHRSSVNIWCAVIGDQLIGPYIFPQRLTGDIYVNF